MKKFLLTAIATFIVAGNISAQVARECVLIEAFTGIGCGYCPAAANGIAQMLDEGLSIAPLAFHNSSYSPAQYATPETNARASYYNVNSFPTVMIDGMNKVAGGGVASQSMYEHYKPYYDQRINVSSPYSIELSFDYHSGTQCYAKAVVNKVGDCDADDVRLFIALSESHIQQAWQGLQELNAVVRDVVTPTTGVEITEDSQEYIGLFSLAGYKKENCTLVAWVQKNNGDKEVYQAVKVSIGDVAPQYDLGIVKVEEVQEESCSGKIRPLMTIRNYGTETINSVNFNIVDAAGTELASKDWTGSLLTGQETEIQFDEINFGEMDFVKIEAVNLNGTDNEDYTIDNTYLHNAGTPDNLPDGYMKILLRTGADPENFSIEIKNMNTGDIVQNLTFDKPNKIYQEEVNLTEQACYRVTLKHALGNGISQGCSWEIRDKNNVAIALGSATMNNFRYELPMEFLYSEEGVESVENIETIDIYPNPASSVINVVATNLSKVNVYNGIGQLVYSQDVDSDIVRINTESWTNGLYYVNIETKDGEKSSQKVIVNK